MKFMKDINSFFGQYQAGADSETPAPQVSFKQNDPEANSAVEGRRSMYKIAKDNFPKLYAACKISAHCCCHARTRAGMPILLPITRMRRLHWMRR